ncbi:unnamed protein product [Calypogeia fissa]
MPQGPPHLHPAQLNSLTGSLVAPIRQDWCRTIGRSIPETAQDPFTVAFAGTDAGASSALGCISNGRSSVRQWILLPLCVPAADWSSPMSPTSRLASTDGSSARLALLYAPIPGGTANKMQAATTPHRKRPLCGTSSFSFSIITK